MKIAELLTKPHSKISFIVGAWTSPAGVPFMAITVHFIADYQLQSLMINLYTCLVHIQDLTWQRWSRLYWTKWVFYTRPWGLPLIMQETTERYSSSYRMNLMWNCPQTCTFGALRMWWTYWSRTPCNPWKEVLPPFVIPPMLLDTLLAQWIRMEEYCKANEDENVQSAPIKFLKPLMDVKTR